MPWNGTWWHVGVQAWGIRIKLQLLLLCLQIQLLYSIVFYIKRFCLVTLTQKYTMKITTKLLDDKVHTLNVLLGRPLTPYKEDKYGDLLNGTHGQVIRCPNYFMIDNSYGGVRLDEMAKGGGVNVILERSTKRELFDQINAMIKGYQIGIA